MHTIRRLCRSFQRTSKDDAGQMLMLFAGGLIVFLGLVGLSLDVGQLVQTRTDLQKTADAAAFAGAQGLPDATSANSIADQYVTLNRDAGTGRQIVVFTTNEADDTITVTATDTVNYIFLGLLGNDGAGVSASATVRIDVVTGYTIDETDTFPYAVWGGDTNNPNCLLDIADEDCEQVFRSNSYENDTDATGPGWDVNGNNFKGYFHAGGDIEVNVTEQTFSKGGNAIGQQPIDTLLAHAAKANSPIIVPVISTASCTGGCGTIEFTIIGWVALQLAPTFVANPAQPWTGTVVRGYAVSQGSTTGPVPPPTEIATYTYTFVS